MVCGLRESEAKTMHMERGRRRSEERAVDKDWKLAGAPAMAGRRTVHRVLYLRARSKDAGGTMARGAARR
jgi:hypothetical protein